MIESFGSGRKAVSGVYEVMSCDSIRMPVAISVRFTILWLLFGCLAHGQRRGCEAGPEYDPVLVANPGFRVTFVCPKATRLEFVQAVGRQTRVPIGVVIGRDARVLLQQRRRYAMRDVDVRTALREAIQGSGYTLRLQDDVFLLVAGDLSRRQRGLLEHRYADFTTNPGDSLSGMGQVLTMWMRIAAGARTGFLLGGLSSTNEEGFTLPAAPLASTEEIANQIVRLGPHGMWIFRAGAAPSCGEPLDTVDVESYQHYSNQPTISGER